jgi:transposase
MSILAVSQSKIIQQQAAKILLLQHELAQLKRLIYGSKSERFVGAENPQQLSLPLIEEEHQPTQSTSPAIHVDAHSRNKKQEEKKHPVRNAFPESLPREIIIIQPKGDITGYKKIGEEITEVLELVEAKIFVKRYVREKYISPDEQKIIIGQLPSRPIEKGLFGEHLIAQIITDKYVDHLPLHRQIERFKRAGIKLSASTLNDTVKNICALLTPLYDCLHTEVVSANYLQADETPIKVLDSNVKRKTHRGYHWVYHAVKKKLVLFDYRPGRGRAGPAEILKHYKGYLQTDGYNVYDAFAVNKNITLLGCMAHVRRKFDEAKDNDGNRAEYALQQIQKLYATEGDIRNNASLSADEIIQIRTEQSQPVLHELQRWMQENLQQVLPKSAIGVAIQYALWRWKKLYGYTENAALQIDNNLIENTIRPVALGRKNYLFAGSHEGARRAAIIYSFFGTCKLNDINPQQWLADVLLKINDTKMSQITTLLPTNQQVS